MTALDSPDTHKVTVELVSGIPEHIRFRHAEESLCGADCTDEDARTLSAETDPLADSSLHLCPECADEWLDVVDSIEREETVRCAVDRADEGTLYTCCDVVAAEDARRLDHPDSDEPVPVCPSCYEWLREYPSNGITTPYEDAASWGDHSADE